MSESIADDKLKTILMKVDKIELINLLITQKKILEIISIFFYGCLQEFQDQKKKHDIKDFTLNELAYSVDKILKDASEKGLKVKKKAISQCWSFIANRFTLNGNPITQAQLNNAKQRLTLGEGYIHELDKPKKHEKIDWAIDKVFSDLENLHKIFPK